MPIRILLIDDHTLFRSGLKQLLQRQEDFDIIAEAADGVEGVKRAKAFHPDVILLDLNMPGLSGLETLQLLVQDIPSAAVVILTVSEEAEELTEALRQGALGYLVKNIDVDVLVSAVRRTAAGEPFIGDNMTAKLIDQFRHPGPPASPLPAAAGDADIFTPREREIISCLVQGESNKEIARELDITESTVKIHVQNILKKLNLSSRVQIAVYAVEHGLASQNMIYHTSLPSRFSSRVPN